MLSKASSNPSIQSFYDRRPVTKEHEPTAAGDGFTKEEVNEVYDPLKRKWNPEREYDELSISELVPGPRAVTFMGRVVNMSTFFGQSPKQPKAAGWHYAILRDDSAAVSVKLYFPHQPYPLRLGQLLSIWTAFISDTSKSSHARGKPSITISGPPLSCANIFPGRVNSDHIIIHTSDGGSSVCRTPLDYQPMEVLPGLMTLANYLRGGHDGVVGVKLLVCVKSLGARRKITRKAGGAEIELTDVLLFDHTDEVRLTLWSDLIDSAKLWTPGKTLLLISNPAFKVTGYSARGSLAVQHATMVDVDPEFADAEWLRRFVAGLAKRESLCVDVPEGVWDVDAVVSGVWRIYFTLAEVDEWVRSHPHHIFAGWINVTIMDMSLALSHRRNMLMCAECCGVPIYANTLTTTCRSCSQHLNLSLNPKIIGTVVDETGCIAAGKLIWSTAAWAELLGRSVKELTAMTSDEISWLEQRIVFTRMHLAFGWAESVGRLVILAMRC